jgi:hypothetical protein
MPTVDAQHRELEFRIMVVGGASEFFVESLPLEDGHMDLGQIQGWRPRLSFRTYPNDPWAGDGSAGAGLEQYAPHVDGLVLTDTLASGQHYSSTAVERLARTLRPAKIGIPSAIFGLRALEEEWTTLSGVRPVYVGEPTAEHALPAVKAMCAALLRSKMRSTPPPPPEGMQGQ